MDHQQIKQEILQVKLDYGDLVQEVQVLRESMQGQSFRLLEEESGSNKSSGNSLTASRDQNSDEG